MKPQNLHKLFLFIAIALLVLVSCNKPPFKPDYYMATGFVIGKEVCNADTTKEYWLIDIISSPSPQQQYGDTIQLNGVQYTNVVKTSDLPNEMRKAGTKIGMDFYLSKDKEVTASCTTSSPVIFYLKVAKVLNWFWSA